MRPRELDALMSQLEQDGFRTLGPRATGDGISLGPVRSIGDLPRGIGDQQRPGHYRIFERSDEMLFSWAVGPTAPKRELFVPRAPLVQIRRKGQELSFQAPAREARPIAFVGLRPCEVEGVLVQDRVFDGAYPDDDYRARRRDAFIFVVSCGAPASTCFCASMGTGPAAKRGFDLAATELGPEDHRFVVEAGSERGAALLTKLETTVASERDRAEASRVHELAAQRMGRSLETDGLRDALIASPEHARWKDAAARCLGCTSCTMVCPTCFCSTVEDTTSLDGAEAERVRRWDSCFTADFAYVHGGTVRPSVGARYRHFLTHKLATWHDQFGTSGCVGCGRCIAWCPVGIDITEEARAIAAAPSSISPRSASPRKET